MLPYLMIAATLAAGLLGILLVCSGMNDERPTAAPAPAADYREAA